MPTLAGYIVWIRGVMGITTAQLPDNSPVIGYSFAIAEQIVNQSLIVISCTIYELAVYNLAGDNLLNFAPDQPGSNFFSTVRSDVNLTGFVAGVVAASGDESTNQTLEVPEAMKNLTFSDLQNLKTPYGRQYLAFAQMYGAMWGIS